MPRGQSPNSKANLANGYRFNKGNARENQEKGRESRKKNSIKKQTVRLILETWMNTPISEAPSDMQKLANKIGLDKKATIKDLFIYMCMRNTIKGGDLGALEKLTGLLGEQLGGEKQHDNGILDQLASYLGRVFKSSSSFLNSENSEPLSRLTLHTGKL